MNFVVVIPVLNQFEEAETYLSSWFDLAAAPLDVLFIDNGSKSQWADQKCVKVWQKDGHRIHTHRLPENIGVYPTFQVGYDVATEIYGEKPWVFYSHSDVEMLCAQWDQHLDHWLEIAASRNGGVVGMFGAKGLGLASLYREPYDYRQLMRWRCYCVESMLHGGALRCSELEPVIVLDGFTMALSSAFIKAMGKFDHDRFPAHHCYDTDICLESYYRGFKNYVVDVDCIHHGGMTSTREKWAEKWGKTDTRIHREAHRILYDKWRGKLPVFVK